MEKAIETRVGDTVAFLLHDSVTGDGANTDCHITTMAFGRLTDVQLQGAT